MKKIIITASVLVALILIIVTFVGLNEYKYNYYNIVMKDYDELCEEFGQLYNHTYRDDGSVKSACIWKNEWWYKNILKQKPDEHEYIVIKVNFDHQQTVFSVSICRENIEN